MTYKKLLTILNECTAGEDIYVYAARLTITPGFIVQLKTGNSKYEKIFTDAELAEQADNAELHLRACINCGVRAVCEGE